MWQLTSVWEITPRAKRASGQSRCHEEMIIDSIAHSLTNWTGNTSTSIERSLVLALLAEKIVIREIS